MLQTLSSVVTLLLSATTISGLPVPDGTWPISTGSVTFDKVYTVRTGEVFDGKMQTFDRFNLTCQGQQESDNSTAVFQLEAGATLKNVIIGVNQMEGVHCDFNDCTIENVWWEDVCEDGLSVKGGNASSVTRVLGGGARYAKDKIIQHNGFGTVVVDGFYAQDFGKLYRACGNCRNNPAQRFLNVSNTFVDLEIIQSGRGMEPNGTNVSIVMMNENFGDEAVLKNLYVKPSWYNYTECASSFGVNVKGAKPVILHNGPKYPVCQYSYDDVHIVDADENAEQQQQQQEQQQQEQEQQLQVQVQL